MAVSKCNCGERCAHRASETGRRHKSLSLTAERAQRLFRYARHKRYSNKKRIEKKNVKGLMPCSCSYHRVYYLYAGQKSNSRFHCALFCSRPLVAFQRWRNVRKVCIKQNRDCPYEFSGVVCEQERCLCRRKMCQTKGARQRTSHFTPSVSLRNVLTSAAAYEGLHNA